jgi:hypothetical protein
MVEIQIKFLLDRITTSLIQNAKLLWRYVHCITVSGWQA